MYGVTIRNWIVTHRSFVKQNNIPVVKRKNYYWKCSELLIFHIFNNDKNLEYSSLFNFPLTLTSSSIIVSFNCVITLLATFKILCYWKCSRYCKKVKTNRFDFFSFYYSTYVCIHNTSISFLRSLLLLKQYLIK